MARPLRIEFEGALHHVISRGNAGEDVFISRVDRERFYTNLEKAVERYGIRIHTFCLMTNHYHLLVETPHANLSRAMKWINVSYAAYFNRKRERSGHLFQGRFKSILVQADEYLKNLSRYIHLNPVRARMAENPVDHEWSSYAAFVGARPSPAWLETRWLLGTFAGKPKVAARLYREFVENADAASLQDPGRESARGGILGDNDFVDWIRTAFLDKPPEQKFASSPRTMQGRHRLEAVVAAVCDAYGCDAEQVKRKGRKRNAARDVAIYLARDLTDLSGVALGDYFGRISGAGIAVRYRHVAGEIARDSRLKRSVERIRGRIIK